ncbi:MAG: SIMPL domain-containing protein [Flavobacteriales bacterium]|nr:MAG: SIMPL domain-containing protein [Flavobacteriales bacterium]
MKTHFSSIAFALAIILAALSFSNAYKFKYKSNNSVSVTGLGSKDFVSDLIVWSGSFIRKNGSLKDAYAELDSDRDKIKKYLLKQGTSTDEIIFSAVDIDKEFADVWDDSGTKTISVFSGYRLTQRVQIESKDVDKVEAISRQVTELINSGIEFYSSSPEYYYTKLAELKIEMIAEATKDANTRAKKIAENAGSDIGALKNASMGVFQIVAQNSAEEYSWGGSFNTASKRKTASITVKLEYEAE